jgi:hypothetical protein
MIYTVGLKSGYDSYLSSDPNPEKLGREPGYPGGSVWRTEPEALEAAMVLPGYAVYGVLADWALDTASVPDGEESYPGERSLLRTSKLVVLH